MDERKVDMQSGEQDEARRRKQELRRKRRIRSQIAAYFVIGGLLCAAAAGVAVGVDRLTKEREEAGRQESQANQDKIDELISSGPALATPAPTPGATAEPTPQEKLEALIDGQIKAMSLEDKVAGLFIVTPEAITHVNKAVRAGESTKKALEEHAVGGLIYFSGNIQSREQITEMLRNTAEYSRYPIFLAVDGEGGRVDRIADAGISQRSDNAQKIGATGDPENARRTGEAMGKAMAELGFNLDFAPVADVANVEGSVMRERSYGSDPEKVAGFVTAMMEGLEEQGVTACLKHFPGIGSTTADTHNGLAFTERTEAQFRVEELSVFQAGIGAGANMIMVGHMSAPSLTGNNDPCIFSERLITEILRVELGFEGIIITDALNMKAISEYYGADEAAIMALKAGCDMLLMPEDYDKAYSGVLQAVKDGVISEERIDDSLRRIYRVKEADSFLSE